VKKLVRDKIPDILSHKHSLTSFYAADNEEFWIELKKKLLEEVQEFLESESEEELVDILEVIYAICQHKEISLANLEERRQLKAEERGIFSKKIIADFSHE